MNDDLSKTLNQPATQSAGTALERSAAAAANARPPQAVSLAVHGNGGKTVTTQPEVQVGAIKPVDRRTIEGSTPGDFRSQTVGQPVFPSNPAFREPVGQSQVKSSKLDSPSASPTMIGASEARRT
jgi:hypothetical protein